MQLFLTGPCVLGGGGGGGGAFEACILELDRA